GNVYRTGFMGAGKTTVGRLLAQELNRRFVDMDDLLEAEFGRPIHQGFAQEGEDFFRANEEALLKRLARRCRLVVATGGGLPQKDQNRDLMRNSGQIVCLAAGFDSCLARIRGQGSALRPLWQDEESVRWLFEKRKKFYADCHLSVPVDGQSAQEAARQIAARLLPETRFTVGLDGLDCPVVCTPSAPQALENLIGERRTALLTDRRVARLHLDRYLTRLKDPLVVAVSGGERIKTLASAGRICQKLLDNRFHRDDLLIALGGGAVTDLGAFVAATYMRGMDFVLASTSLLGCVDAALGGKAAVNLGRAKNVVGCFSSPLGVVLDVAALKTLSRRRISEGLVEAYKTGLIARPKLAQLIEDQRRALLAKDLPLLSQVASRSAQAKAEIVSQDFREAGPRRVLNLGHTFGHAVESWHRYRVSHGQAVGLGLVVAARLSRARGLISPGLTRRIISTVGLIAGRPIPAPPAAEAWELMQSDKKIRRGRLVFVLLEDIGQPLIVDDVSPEELAEALKGL
ncbi:MAG: bifunctional shikimate kinase/3-dehydroquinate synthase, partial [Deltaproteobacteria bacterium]|nr:bifunctional shikimate kinase/3-dehydroquinate synthase [Deltaproteobacteria bacterium]